MTSPRATKAVLLAEAVRLHEQVASKDRRIAEQETALAESGERETATSEILHVISSSPTDLQPVLETIATNAARVCGAYDAQVLLREDDFVRIVAHHGSLEA